MSTIVELDERHHARVMDLLCRDPACTVFLDNPAAGRIYCKAGFRDAGPWLSCSR
jgi:hypothetical protein